MAKHAYTKTRKVWKLVTVKKGKYSKGKYKKGRYAKKRRKYRR